MVIGNCSLAIAGFHYLLSSFLHAVPAAPQNVTLTNISFQLLVGWATDPPNGLISNYTIYVTRVEKENMLLKYTSTDTQFVIPSGALDPYELVSVSVSASNSAGEGARCPGVRGRTREKRKSLQQECDPSLRVIDMAGQCSVFQILRFSEQVPYSGVLRHGSMK